MVNWHDPALVLQDYIALIKLNHAIAGIYIWETVTTVGFEWDVLRGKRPYRWTIWLYLGTRYTSLLAFIFFFIVRDGPEVPCQSFLTVNFALPYASWAFASLIIVLRVIAIWNRNIIVSLLAAGVFSVGLALNIRSLTMIEGTYNAFVKACIVLHTRRGLVNSICVLVVDLVLLLMMLVGLLQHTHRGATGLWKLLYQQCIIWIFLALLAEIPPMVFLSLNLNDAWNEMFAGVAVTILSIGAARMYRSLSDHGSFTEYVSSDHPPFSSDGTTTTTTASHRRRVNVYGPMNFASVVTQSERTRTTSLTCEAAPVFLPADQIHLDFIPGVSNPSFTHGNADNNNNNFKVVGYESV